MSTISGYHHLTMSTDGAQEDFDFYTKDLGLHSVKRTVLFDGSIPVYHLYYGSPNGDASTIITTFPFRKPGVYGRRGTNQSRTIAGVARNFKIIIEGNGGTQEQIYAKVQYLLRQNSDINTGGTAGTKTGKIQDELLRFVGDTLVTSQSVYIDDVLSADSNRVQFYDDTNTLRENLYEAAGTMTFNAPLVGAGSSYRLMFKDPPGAVNDFGESGAITVNNAAGTPITGTISSGSINFTYDYDGNVQGGYTAGTNRNVVLIGIKPGSGKYVAAEGVLTRSKAISLSLVAEADRVYA